MILKFGGKSRELKSISKACLVQVEGKRKASEKNQEKERKRQRKKETEKENGRTEGIKEMDGEQKLYEYE